MNYHQKSSIGGELGAELNRIIDMVRENRIVSSPGVRVEHKPNGTTLHMSQAPAAGSDQVIDPLDPDFAFVGDPGGPSDIPRRSPIGDSAAAFKYLSINVQNTANKNVSMFFLPPIENVQSFNAPTSSYFVHENKNFPLDLYDGTSGWRFTKELTQGKIYSVANWQTASVAVSSFPANPNGASGTIAGGVFFHGPEVVGYLVANQLEFYPTPWEWIP